MFDWLIPSFLMQNLPARNKSMMQMRIIDVQQLDDLYSLSHPFLTCSETIQHLRQTKVMFLMRGLPGSGKSTLVKILKQIYSKSVTVCSADNFFLDDQGVYNFNRDRISEAHRVCQQKTEEACRTNVLAVIIDNTNIRMDECKIYFQKASNYGYVVIIVEPRTSWKRDADILNERNTHQVPRDVIETRLRQFSPLIPFYFGLFLNEEQTNFVLARAKDFYQQAVTTFPQLRKDLEQISREKNIPVQILLDRKNMNAQSKVLHCTVKFIGKITDQSRKEYTNYAANRCVAHLLGKVCRGYVMGFTITPRTLAARLMFPDRHTWAIWDQDDNEAFPKPSAPPASTYNSKQRPNRRNQKNPVSTTTDMSNTGDEYDTSMAKSMADDDLLLVDKIPSNTNQAEEVSFLHPTFGFLSRAHLTCGVAPGVSAAQTGLDMVEMIRQESEAILKNRSPLENGDEQSVMKFFGNGHCIVYLREPIPINTVFSGFFH